MNERWTAADLPDLTGQVFVVTGASGGIGLVMSRELARAGADVVMAVRNLDKGAQAARTIGPARGAVELRLLDVADLDSVRAFAASWTGKLDVLINNAGIMMVPYAATADGLESQMATNYFGPFALTNALLPDIGGRVVHTASQLHRQGRIRPGELDRGGRRYDPWKAYCDSKLAVVLFSLELQRRLDAAHRPVRSVVAHPGIAKTNLVAHVGGFSGWLNGLAQPLLNDLEPGALPTLYAATQDVPANAYVGPDGLGSVRGYPKVRRPGRRGRDAQAAAQLWEATVEKLGKEFDFAL
ncbi:SDR family NAD(P)-dependent oxidoreductase [Kineosporia sp. J2-2]|uniref:SDR family NAD(P)-dependent oxidoreductase n=1 Tax=Kineosporia corallincola TaxID=2835133 RepID=A0ABS5TBI5_9ACTN|nr:SDR family NAD(P)-dependent oxidoreductase [Kineosporia corallincola]MBT0768438.1 SDR family NAD(P)-dependent oxidoreductase [Kineosporia corallincola]